MRGGPRRWLIVAMVVPTMLVALAPARPAGAVSGWTTFASGPGSMVLACKRATSSKFGPLWQVTVAALSSTGTTAAATFRVLRGGTTISTLEVSARNGEWVTRTTYASRWYVDTYDGTAGTGNTAGQGRGSQMSGRVMDLVTCG